MKAFISNIFPFMIIVCNERRHSGHQWLESKIERECKDATCLSFALLFLLNVSVWLYKINCTITSIKSILWTVKNGIIKYFTLTNFSACINHALQIVSRSSFT